MMTAMTTSLESKHLRHCDYFAIVLLCSHHAMLEKYAKT